MSWPSLPPLALLACQTDIVWEDKPANFDRVRRLLEEAAPAPGSLVLLPEMFATGFSMNAPALAEDPGGATEQFLARLARHHQVALLGGVITRGAGGLGRNEAVAFAPDGSLLTRYGKIHPFSPGGEHRHYEAGTTVTLFRWQGWVVSPFICYDIRFPEGFRAAAAGGAQLLVVIANWPASRLHHWIPLLQARAIENQAWVVGVTRCGRSPQEACSGHSLVVDPQGRIQADAGESEGVLRAQLEPGPMLELRRDFPALADMRPIAPARGLGATC